MKIQMGLICGVFVGNLIGKRTFGASWTESVCVAALASVIMVFMLLALNQFNGTNIE